MVKLKNLKVEVQFLRILCPGKDDQTVKKENNDRKMGRLAYMWQHNTDINL